MCPKAPYKSEVNQLLDTICDDDESFKPSRSTPLRKDAAKLQSLLEFLGDLASSSHVYPSIFVRCSFSCRCHLSKLVFHSRSVVANLNLLSL